MAPLRLRHPKGISTLQLDLDTATVQDLLQAIFSESEIPPSAQDLKAGYPPRALTGVIPELPISSLGLAPGDQLIVNQKSGSAALLGATPAAASLPPSASNPRPAATAPSAVQSGAPDFVKTDGGYLVHRIVPDDNSCMFASVALLFEQNMQKAPVIRQSMSPHLPPPMRTVPSRSRLVVAEAIRRDPETWSDAILGRPRDDYIRTILSPNSWGGAIELAILAAHYRTEIASIDVETGRVDRFGDAHASEGRALLIYSGIHYDACRACPPARRTSRIFAALATKLRAKRAYTNTATFDLKCEVCGKGLKGEKEARAHASETGHVKFGEF
ncbi:OTU-domain-containing protein [Lactarius indigo]|nr:OTU-domain-containing protein [Lactarius indigo]